MNEERPSDADQSAVSQIVERWRKGGLTLSWLNHYSALVCDWSALRQLDMIGIDGTFLQVILRSQGIDLSRTSADLTLPAVLDVLAPEGATVALVGGAPAVAELAARRLPCRTVFCADGYDDLARLREDPRELVEAEPDIVLLGLGAPLQDVVAAEFAKHLPDALIATVGGWIDQLTQADQYFPPLVHRLRLGWLWRVVHEPRRLFKRYTIFAVRAVVARTRTAANVRSISRELSDSFVMVDSGRGAIR